MMTRFCALLGFLLLVINSFAQLAEPLVGIEYSTSKKENFSGFIGESSLSTYTADYIFYTKRKQELIIRSFHKGDLQLTNSKDIYSTLDDGYTNEPEEIFYNAGQFYLFSRMHSERDKTELLALEVFNEALDRINFQIIDTVKNDEIQYIGQAADQSGFVVAKHLRFTQLVEQEILLKQVNNQGNIAWAKTLKSPMALQNLRIENIQFSSSGQYFILCNYAFDIRTGEANVGDQMVNNKYAIWAYDRDQEFLKEFEVRLKGKWVNGIEMKILKNQELLVAGYFNETKHQSINGLFSIKIDKGFNVTTTSWHKFEPATLDLFFTKDNKKRVKELDDFVIKSLEIMDDGSFYLLGEQYYKYIERSYDPRTNVTTTTEHYNYNSIITSRFNKKGNHEWTTGVPKYQNSTNDFGYFSSFCTFNSGQDVFLIFNDNEKNNELEYTSEKGYTNLFNNRKFQISYVLLNAEGIQKRGGLIDPKNDFLLRAKLSGQINSESIYLMTETNRSSKIIKVRLKESQ
ncbi:MAG: hypothetical protein ABJG68_02375 [Crocinitomicaceae bacterium]